MISQLAASIGKERRDAAALSGATKLHPYRLPQFKPKIIRGMKKSPVVLGSPVEAKMLDKCEEYIRWMIDQPCTNRRNSGYVTKCQCRADIKEEDISEGALQMVNFFTLSQRGRDVKIQDEVRRGRSRKKNPRFIELGNRRKRKKVERMKGKLFLLYFSYRENARGQKLLYRIQSCLSTYLMFYNIPYDRFKTIENELLGGKKTTPIHKLNGAPSNNATKKHVIDKMRIFFGVNGGGGAARNKSGAHMRWCCATR